MKDVLARVIQETFQGFGQELAAFGPRVLAMIVILLAGVLLAGSLRVVLAFLLRRLGFDTLAERVGLSLALQKVGFTGQASRALAAVTAFVVLAFFVVLAVGSLDLRFARELVSEAVRYLPQVVVAARVSRSGDALPASGDLEGEVGPLDHRSRGVSLVLDRVRP